MNQEQEQKWKYNLKEHQVVEQPTIDAAHKLYKDNDGWEKYRASLRRIPVSGKVDWKDGQEVEMGKDFYFADDSIFAFPLPQSEVPATKRK